MRAIFMKRLLFIICIFGIFIPVAAAERFEIGKVFDAVVEWDNGKAYFFKGSQYVRYDMKADRADPDYPKPINSQTWPGLPWTDRIAAAVNWGNGKAYFLGSSAKSVKACRFW